MMKTADNAPVVGIVGAGASGLMAAIWAARTAEETGRKINTVLFEGNARVGKKLLATGNGRCNLTNCDMDGRFYRGSAGLFAGVYPQLDNTALRDFFFQLGMASRSDFAGRVYPLSNQASSVLDALRGETERLGVKTTTEEKITSVRCYKNGFLLNNAFYADKCILACGSNACPVHGSDGSGYELLRQLGIPVTELFPALTPLIVKNFTKSLKGIRAEGSVTVRCSGKILAAARGEIQYTDYGLSGIPAMQVSRSASELLWNGGGGDVIATVDSVPSMTEAGLTAFLKNLTERNPALPGEMLLAGLMPKRLGTYLLTEVSINPSKPLSAIHPAAVDAIVAAVKNKKYRIAGVKDFNDAQVTAGGVPGAELDNITLETKRIKGLYVCGELADVDGDCGGYNLQWAFSSGCVAGINAVRGIK